MWDLGFFLYILGLISVKHCECCSASLSDDDIYITLKRYGEEIYYCSRGCSLRTIFNTC